MQRLTQQILYLTHIELGLCLHKSLGLPQLDIGLYWLLPNNEVQTHWCTRLAMVS